MGATALADNAYLKRRRGKQRSGFRWYVRVPVPTDIQETVRKQTIKRALKTSDLKEARRLKLPVLAEIFESFERTRGRRITSADIEHKAQRYLRERLEQIQKSPDNTFEMATLWTDPSLNQISRLLKGCQSLTARSFAKAGAWLYT